MTDVKKEDIKIDLACGLDGFFQIVTSEVDLISAEGFEMDYGDLDGIKEAIDRIQFWEEKGYDAETAREELKNIMSSEF